MNKFSYAYCLECEYKTGRYETDKEINDQILKDGSEHKDYCPKCGGQLKAEDIEEV